MTEEQVERVALLPCPFCGGDAWLNDYCAKYDDLPPRSRNPSCRSCGLNLGYLPTPAKAIAAWNTRTATQPTPQMQCIHMTAEMAANCPTCNPSALRGLPTGEATPQEAAKVLIPLLELRHRDYMVSKGRNPDDYASQYSKSAETLRAIAGEDKA